MHRVSVDNPDAPIVLVDCHTSRIVELTIFVTLASESGDEISGFAVEDLKTMFPLFYHIDVALKVCQSLRAVQLAVFFAFSADVAKMFSCRVFMRRYGLLSVPNEEESLRVFIESDCRGSFFFGLEVVGDYFALDS